jgi:hypothetical protein
VLPRAKVVNGRNYEWRCLGLRDLYKIVDWAGKKGQVLTKTAIQNLAAQARDPDHFNTKG